MVDNKASDRVNNIVCESLNLPPTFKVVELKQTTKTCSVNKKLKNLQVLSKERKVF